MRGTWSIARTVTLRAAGTRLRWMLLALAPSSLMLGVTTYSASDIAAVPLLWAVPLSIYLVTFVLAFSRRQPLNPKPVDVNRLVTNMSDLLRRTLGEQAFLGGDAPLTRGALAWSVEHNPEEGIDHLDVLDGERLLAGERDRRFEQRGRAWPGGGLLGVVKAAFPTWAKDEAFIDTLNLKACLFAAEKYFQQTGRRVPIMGRVVADMLETAGVEHLLALDLHSQQAEGFFRIPVENLTAVPLLADALRTRLIHSGSSGRGRRRGGRRAGSPRCRR